jgi:alpha-galactosidase
MRLLFAFLFGLCLWAPLCADAPFTLNDEQIRAALRAEKPLEGAIWLDTLDLSNMTAGYGKPQAGKSVDSKPLTLAGVTYPRGIGTHANSVMAIDLKNAGDRFLAMVGLDDEIGNGKAKVVFRVTLDGKTVFDSGTMQTGDVPKLVNVLIRGGQRLTLNVLSPGGDTSLAHADWAGAMILLDDDSTQRPESVSLAPVTSIRAFPPRVVPGDAPAVHIARIFGCSPKKPFLQRIWATGKAPLKYTALGLPKSLKIDAQTGIISGQIEAPGNYDFFVGVSNAVGKIVVPFSIICGERKLAQTPPMGWNAWNVFGEGVTVAKVKEQADYLIKTGLAAQGFNYVIIDDTWQARREPDGTIYSNKRFGDIEELADYLHERGLKLGLYSTPNLETCSGYNGSYGYEEKDALAYAEWGVDYLKYDWCQVGSNKQNTTPEVMQEAYGRMRKALDKAPRDIVWSLTPYGFGEAWKWAGDLGANSWFTEVGIQDTWNSIKENGARMHDLAKYAGPGRWNDPGWLMLGKFSFGKPRFSNLRAAELQSQVTLWSVVNAPLILSCDLTQLDPNNLYPVNTSLLTNPEVLGVNQDILGKPAVRQGWETEAWTKPLIDGTIAVALINKSDGLREVGVRWWDIGQSGKQPVRDLWLRQELGEFDNEFKMLVPRHGAALVKIGKPLAPDNQWKGLNRTVYLRPTYRWSDGLRWSWSRNGVDWITHNKVRLKPEGNKQMSHIVVDKMPDGTHVALWTIGNEEKNFGFATSKNLLDWQMGESIPLERGALSGALRNARQPNLLWDKKSAQWVITFSAQRSDDKPRGWRLYAMTTKDFKTFGEPQLLLETPYSATDGNMVESNGRYFLIYRDEDKRIIKISVATSPLGPFDVATDFQSLLPPPEPVDPKRKKPAPPRDPGAPLNSWGKEVEAIELLPQGNEWLASFFRAGQAQTHVLLKTKDFKTWSEVTPNNAPSKEFRLGNRIATTETTLMEILRGN